MEAARGGKEKVKELSYKEHRDSKSSIFQRNKSEVACMEKRLQPMASLVLFHTKHTHTSPSFNQGNLLCLSLLIFRGKGVGGGNRRLMRLCQMQRSRGAVGVIYFKQWFVVFDPHPCCPAARMALEPPLSPGLWRSPGNRKEAGALGDALLK